MVQAEAERGCRDTQPRRRPPEGRWIAPGVNYKRAKGAGGWVKMRTTPTNRIASTRPWWQRSTCRQMRGRGARPATSRRHTDKSPKRRRQDAPQSTDRKPVRKQGKHRTHRQVPEQMEHEARPASSWKIESGSVGTTRTPNASKTSAYVPAPGNDSCRGVEPFRDCETASTKASFLQKPALGTLA